MPSDAGPSVHIPFDGAVLCGGSSRRMGRDKALIEVDGAALARRVADALAAAGASSVRAVGGDAVALAALGLVTQPDDHPGEGPLGATITALDAATTDVVMIVACDLVHPSPAAFAAIVRALAASPTSVGAVPVSAGRWQWTHAAWRRGARGGLREAFASGERSLHRAAGHLALVEVTGLDPSVLADADEPSDLV